MQERVYRSCEKNKIRQKGISTAFITYDLPVRCVIWARGV